MLTIELLDPSKHIRERFDCGNDALNYYLKKVARQHSERGVSRTFVLVDTDKPTIILGYYTLTICAVIMIIVRKIVNHFHIFIKRILYLDFGE